MNPYAGSLGHRNALEVIAETPAALKRLLAEIGPDRFSQAPQPGKWSPREILVHLADTEIAFAFRLRQALAEDDYVIQPFDQEKWSTRSAPFQASEALGLFETLRSWNRTLIENVPETDWSKPLSHPERGAMTFRTIVETMGGHDLNHIRQLENIATPAAKA